MMMNDDDDDDDDDDVTVWYCMLIVHLSICVRVNNYSIEFQLPNNAKIQNSALSDRSEEAAEPKCSDRRINDMK